MTPYLFKAGLAAALCGMLATAHAADTAEAAVRDLRFELVDLDLNDGITPSFSFEKLAGGANITGATPGNTIIDHEPDGTTTNYRLHESGTDAVASANFETGNLLASITATRPFAGNILPETVFIVDGDDMSKLVLSAHTRLVILGTASASVTGSGSAIAGYELGFGGLPVIRHSAVISDFHTGAQTFEQRTDLADAYQNDGDTAVNLSFSVYARSSLAASAVPEPGVWTLGAAGLIIGASFSGRSRRRQTSA